MQVLTISVDETLGPVSAYMKEKAYTFPVIHSSQLADKLFPYVGLPTNFLVDGRGVRTGMYGFNPASAGVDLLVEDLTKAAK